MANILIEGQNKFNFRIISNVYTTEECLQQNLKSAMH
jgi:hypothetical protein